MPLQDISNRPIGSPAPRAKHPLANAEPAVAPSPSSIGSTRLPASPGFFTSPQALFSPPNAAPPQHTGITPALAQMRLNSPHPTTPQRTPSSARPSMLHVAALTMAGTLAAGALFIILAPAPVLPPAPPPLPPTA